MEVIATKRGEQKLCFEGFMYTKKNVPTDKLIWRCVKRDDAVKCTAILQTSNYNLKWDGSACQRVINNN